MSTPLTDSINALTAYANEVTGGSDTNLSDAVHTLASGYGGNSQIKIDGETLYLDADTIEIVVNHNLGGVPDFAYICVDVSDGDLIPFGPCVHCSYGIIIPTHLQNITDTTRMRYVYDYRHQTSGNILGGSYSVESSKYSDSIFTFLRGSVSWSAVDANGNPMPYKWMVGKFA